MIASIVIPVVSLSMLAMLLGLCIFVVSKKFYVKTDPLVATINEMLPGVNCGACGYPGCSGLATALVETRDPTKVCPVGGEDLAQQIGQALGIKMTDIKPTICTVLCQGTASLAKPTAQYLGIQDCLAATQVFNGPKICPHACLGFGTCISACKYEALKLVDGLIEVVEDRCVGCGACIEQCPKQVLVMQEKKQDRFIVACRSTDKGGITRKYCTVGCIGCKKCEKICEAEAITINDFCSTIDQKKCTSCGKCVDVCPTKSIVKIQDFKTEKIGTSK